MSAVKETFHKLYLHTHTRTSRSNLQFSCTQACLCIHDGGNKTEYLKKKIQMCSAGATPKIRIERTADYTFKIADDMNYG